MTEDAKINKIMTKEYGANWDTELSEQDKKIP